SLAERTGAEVDLTGHLERRPPAAVEAAAYFVVAESLTNTAKHAPGARVRVGLSQAGGRLAVEIVDTGPGGAIATGSGLTGLRQRVGALDGTLEVSSPAGQGTRVRAELPCE
ncbi:MAG: ATP-binding protein, partial [Solirubrobacteraceae bacterium]